MTNCRLHAFLVEEGSSEAELDLANGERLTGADLRRLVETNVIAINDALRLAADPSSFENVVVRVDAEFDVEKWMEHERARLEADELS